MKYIILLIVLFSSSMVFSQEYCENFDHNSQNDDAFYDGEYLDWINVSGSADDKHGPGGSSNGGYAHMYVNYVWGCPTNANVRTESIALTYNLVGGQTYEFQYRAESVGRVNLEWYFTNDLSNASGGGSNNCVPGDVNTIHPIPEGAILIDNVALLHETPVTRTINVTVPPNSNFNYIWARPKPLEFGESFNHLYIDFFKIICGNESAPVVDWNLENQNGDEGNSFCLGDDVFIDFTNSSNYDQWFIQVCQTDQITGELLGCMNYTQWAQDGQVDSPLNLTDHDSYFNYNGNYFDFSPGYNYNVQLSLINECTGWTNTFMSFAIDCLTPIECNPPSDLFCLNGLESGVVLNWSSVPDAISYELEFLTFDPECCSVSFGSDPISISIGEGTSYNFNFPPKCFSWRVRSICEDDTSEWSEKMCMDSKTDCSGNFQNDSESDTRSTDIAGVHIYPNPMKDRFIIELTEDKSAEIIQSYKLINTQGVEFISKANLGQENKLEVNSAGLPSGIYYILLNTDKGSYVNSVIKL